MTTQELDVRPLRKPDQDPALFQAFDALAVSASFVLGDSHDAQHLREESETHCPWGYGWEYLVQGPHAWRVRISKLSVHLRRPALDPTPST